MNKLTARIIFIIGICEEESIFGEILITDDLQNSCWNIGDTDINGRITNEALLAFDRTTALDEFTVDGIG